MHQQVKDVGSQSPSAREESTNTDMRVRCKGSLSISTSYPTHSLPADKATHSIESRHSWGWSGVKVSLVPVSFVPSALLRSLQQQAFLPALPCGEGALCCVGRLDVDVPLLSATFCNGLIVPLGSKKMAGPRPCPGSVGGPIHPWIHHSTHPPCS